MRKNYAVFKGTLTLLALLAASFTVLAADISQSDLVNKLKEANPPVVLDVRSAEEFADGHIPGAINISHDELEKRLTEVSAFKQTEIVLYCRSGRRAGLAETLLLANGFNEINHLDGDFNAWTANDMPTEK